MQKPYLDFNINALPDVQIEVSLGSSLTLHDNLDRVVDWDKAMFGVPLKLKTTIIIFFCLGGEVTLEAGTERYTMYRGDVQFTKSGLFGSVSGMSKDVKFAAIFIDEKFYFPVVSGTDVSALQRRLATHPICKLPEYSLEECMKLYRLMKDRLLHHTEDTLQNEILRGYLQAMVLNVYSQYLMAHDKDEAEGKKQDDFQKKGFRQQELFNKFMALLQKDYTRERNIKYYANELCVTPRYLSRVIHDVSGLFASDHIDHFVIEEAKQLIRSKKYTISQVSDLLNFTSQSFFGRYFKKFTGYTPKQYEELG
jgi:AraC family transcriptional activator of pobA